MVQHIAEATVNGQRVELDGVPYADGTQVKVIVEPKAVDLEEGLDEIWEITSSIPGNLSDDIVKEREAR